MTPQRGFQMPTLPAGIPHLQYADDPTFFMETLMLPKQYLGFSFNNGVTYDQGLAARDRKGGTEV